LGAARNGFDMTVRGASATSRIERAAAAPRKSGNDTCCIASTDVLEELANNIYQRKFAPT